LRLPLPTAARSLEQERVEPQPPAARLLGSDRDLRLELVVAELLDAVATVEQRPAGAFVVSSSQLALPLAGTCRLMRSQVFHRTVHFCNRDGS
jgi:hypothetical protein